MIKDSLQLTVPSWQLKKNWITNLPVMFRYKHYPHIIFSSTLDPEHFISFPGYVNQLALIKIWYVQKISSLKNRSQCESHNLLLHHWIWPILGYVVGKQMMQDLTRAILKIWPRLKFIMDYVWVYQHTRKYKCTAARKIVMLWGQ